MWGKWLLLQKRFCERFPPNFGSPNFLKIGFSVSAFLWCIWLVSEQFSGQFYQLCCNYICIFGGTDIVQEETIHLYTSTLQKKINHVVAAVVFFEPLFLILVFFPIVHHISHLSFSLHMNVHPFSWVLSKKNQTPITNHPNPQPTISTLNHLNPQPSQPNIRCSIG